MIALEQQDLVGRGERAMTHALYDNALGHLFIYYSELLATREIT
jgi:hypothetical protein